MNFTRDLEGPEDESALRFDSLTLVQLIPVELLAEDDSLSQENTYLVDLPTSYPDKETVFKPIKYQDLEIKDGRYLCPYCDRTYSKKYLVPRHIKIQHENTRVTCKICSKSVRNIFQHNKKTHGLDVSVKCLICLQIFKSKSLLREHCRKDHGDECTPNTKVEEMQCPVCNVSVMNKRSLWISHIFYQHLVSPAFYACPLPNCNGRISKIEDEHNLRSHLQNAHDLRPGKILTCPVCPGRALTEEDLEVHTNQHHKENKFPCRICSQVFSCYGMMALHLFQTHKCILRGKSDKYRNISEEVFVQKCDDFQIKGYREDDKNEASNKPINEETEPVPMDLTKIEATDQKTGLFDKSSKSGITKNSFVGDIQLCKVGYPRFATAFPKKKKESHKILRHDKKVQIFEDEETIIINIDDGEAVKVEEKTYSVVQQGNQNQEIIEEYDEEIEESNDEMFIEIDEEKTEMYIEIEDEKAEIINRNSASSSESVVKFVLQSESLKKAEEIPQSHEDGAGKRDYKTNASKTVSGTSKSTSESAKYKCTWPDCTKEFVHRSSVSMHIRNVHESKAITCEVCKNTYSNADNYRTHYKTVHKATSTPCTWPGCSKVLSSKRQMQGHVLKHKQSCRPCPYIDCKAVLKNSVTLRMHIKKIHGHRKRCENPLECDVCLKRQKMRIGNFRLSTKFKEHQTKEEENQVLKEDYVNTSAKRKLVQESDEDPCHTTEKNRKSVAIKKKYVKESSKRSQTITTYSFKNR